MWFVVRAGVWAAGLHVVHASLLPLPHLQQREHWQAQECEPRHVCQGSLCPLLINVHKSVCAPVMSVKLLSTVQDWQAQECEPLPCLSHFTFNAITSADTRMLAPIMSVRKLLEVRDSFQK
jgi:hypothetical protein